MMKLRTEGHRDTAMYYFDNDLHVGTIRGKLWYRWMTKFKSADTETFDQAHAAMMAEIER